MKFYHASTVHHKVGDILLPRKTYSGGRGIYCTNSPKLHYTMDKDWANGKKFRLYRVHPRFGKYHLGDWDDFVCPKGVIILESLGDAPNQKVKSAVKPNHTVHINEISNKPRYLLEWKVNGKFKKRGFKRKSSALKKFHKIKGAELYDRKKREYIY